MNPPPARPGDGARGRFLLASAGMSEPAVPSPTPQAHANGTGNGIAASALRRAIQNHVILKKPNVVFTPHNAFNSQEALERILDTTIANIQAFAAGTPKNVVG